MANNVFGRGTLNAQQYIDRLHRIASWGSPTDAAAVNKTAANVLKNTVQGQYSGDDYLRIISDEEASLYEGALPQNVVRASELMKAGNLVWENGMPTTESINAIFDAIQKRMSYTNSEGETVRFKGAYLDLGKNGTITDTAFGNKYETSKIGIMTDVSPYETNGHYELPDFISSMVRMLSSAVNGDRSLEYDTREYLSNLFNTT